MVLGKTKSRMLAFTLAVGSCVAYGDKSWAGAASSISSGCQASNFTADGTNSYAGLSPKLPLSSFTPGEVITMAFTTTSYVSLDDAALAALLGITVPGTAPKIYNGEILSYTITAADVASSTQIDYSFSDGFITVSCTAGATTSTQSNVRSIQLAGTKVSSLTAANSFSSGIGNNVANRLPLCPAGSGDASSGTCRAPGAAPNAGVGSPSYLGAKNRQPSVKDQATEARPNRSWNVWGDMRQSGFDRDDQASLKQVTAMGGIDFLLHQNLLLGFIGGYEHSDFKADVLQGTLKGNGSTVGVYGGYRFSPSIRGDLAVTWTWLDYDVADNSSATPITANFGAVRNMISAGLTGSYLVSGIVAEPSARIFSIRQNEAAYTDSSATAQAARDFSAGRASFGSKFSLPYAAHAGLFVSPYAGLYGDYRFGSDTA